MLPEYRGRGLDAILTYETTAAAMRKGYKHIEASWILATNLDTRRIIENFGGRLYKTYRVYQKDL